MKLRILGLLFLFFVPFFWGCATNPVTHKTELSLLSVQGEKRIGKEVILKISKESLSQGPLIRSGWAVDYLQSIVNRFMPFYERRGEMPVSLVIAPVAVPNAWSIPGYITVNIGIIPCLDDEAQLAFILGHELGHIAARHTAQRYTQGVLLSLGVQGAGLYGGQLAALISNIAASLYIASYSRSQERMADALGFKYMSMAGYDPYQAPLAMKNIEICGNAYMKAVGMKKVSGIVGFLERLFADHPSTKERVRVLTLKAKTFGKRGAKGHGDFYRLKKWAQERKSVLIKLDKAYFLAKDGKEQEAKEQVERVLDIIEKRAFEPEIKAKVYALSGLVYLMNKNYKEAWKKALKATVYKKDYYVSYKIAGVAGLRDDSLEGLKVAERAFENCIEYKSTDPDYKLFLGVSPVDKMCLEGAIISSCKLKHRKKCRAYCRYFYRKYKGYPASIVKYCLF